MHAKLFRPLLFFCIFLALLTGCSKEKPADQTAHPPGPGPSAGVEVPEWRVVESSISQTLLSAAGGKCEWDVWGWARQDVYIWAFCQTGPETHADATSSPLVVRVAGDGTVESITIPDAGEEYTLSITRIFPPQVQEKIFANEFDPVSAIDRLETRWNYPSMPPAIYARTGNPLPRTGPQAVQAVSAASVEGLTPYTILGQGNVKRVQYLPDGKIMVAGDRGMGFLDLEQGKIDYQYQTLLAGRPGFLSRDDVRLAAVGEQVVEIYDSATQSLQSSIDTSQIEGYLYKVEFLADGLTLMVEKRVPNEGFPTGKIALFRIDDGALINRWEIKGGDFVLSPDGWTMTGLYDLSGLEVWSVARGELLYKLPFVARDVSFSADGQIMAVAQSLSVKLFWVWDGFEIGSLEKNIGAVSGVALSPDGKMALTWSDGPYPARLWRVPSFEPVATLDIQGVSAAAFNPDGSSIVLVGDAVIGLYELEAGEFTRIPADIYSEVTDLSFAPDRSFNQGQHLAVAYRPGPEHSVVVKWNLPTKSAIFTQSELGVSKIAYASDDVGIAVIARGDRVKLLSTEDGSLVREYDIHSTNLSDLALDSTNHLAIGKSYEIRIYRLTDEDDRLGRKIELPVRGVQALAWSCFLTAATDQAGIQVFDETGQTLLQELSIPYHGYTTSLAFLPDCSQLMVAANNQVFRWRTNDWQDLEPWTLPGYITSLDISQDGSLAAAGHSDGSVTLLDSTSGTALKTLQEHGGWVSALEFSPDGRFLATGGSDGLVMIWGIK